MGLLDKLAQKRYEQRIDKNIKRAKELMAAGKYQESHALLKDMALEMDEDEERYDVVIDLQVECEQVMRRARAETQYHKGMSCYMRKEYVEAQEYFRLPVERGHAGAQYQLGLMYGMGQGVEKDLEKAVALMQKAAAGGVKEAPEVLAMMQGQWAEAGGPQPAAPTPKPVPKPEPKPAAKVENDPVRAERALETGVRAYQQGDYVSAAKYFREAADAGIAEAQYILGQIYKDGAGVTQSNAEAVKWIRKAAEQGISQAQYSLGNMYANGEGVTQSKSEAVKWYHKAAEQGYAEAQFNLGVMYHNGADVTQNNAEAMKWFRKAAEQGVAEAQLNLGAMYAQGKGVTQNKAEAVKWYHKAAEQGLAEAQVTLAAHYAAGLGVGQDMAEAERWSKLAADSGDKTAAELLESIREARAGSLCDMGVAALEQQDYVSASKHLQEAAELGSVEAQFNLGLMYHRGDGVTQNNAEAVKWFRKAAEQGYADAQFNLALCYARGEGVSLDLADAEKWAKRAADNGYEDAAELLAAIRNDR